MIKREECDDDHVDDSIFLLSGFGWSVRLAITSGYESWRKHIENILVTKLLFPLTSTT